MKHCRKCENEVGSSNYCHNCRKEYMDKYRIDTWYNTSREQYLRSGVWTINNGS